MSEVEYHKGILKKVPMWDGENIEDQIKRVLKNAEIGKWCKNYVETILSDYSKEYTVIKNTLYEIKDENYEDTEEIFESTEKPDGTIDYVVRFYNGGCCLNEALEYALKRCKQQCDTNQTASQ